MILQSARIMWYQRIPFHVVVILVAPRLTICSSLGKPLSSNTYFDVQRWNAWWFRVCPLEESSASSYSASYSSSTSYPKTHLDNSPSPRYFSPNLYFSTDLDWFPLSESQTRHCEKAALWRTGLFVLLVISSLSSRSRRAVIEILAMQTS